MVRCFIFCLSFLTHLLGLGVCNMIMKEFIQAIVNLILTHNGKIYFSFWNIFFGCILSLM
jgi:hypothetical protein